MIFLTIGLIWEIIGVLGGFFILFYLEDTYTGREKPVWYEDLINDITWFVTVRCHLVALAFLILGIIHS